MAVARRASRVLLIGWDDAIAAFQKSIALDDDDPHSHTGAAMAVLKLGLLELAADRALQSTPSVCCSSIRQNIFI